MLIPILATVLCAALFIAEKRLTRGREVKISRRWDGYSSLAIKLASMLVPVGIVFGFTGFSRIQSERVYVALSGFALALAGVLIRRKAVRTLDQYFTLNVTILEDHRLVKDGIYGTIRHPSYTGFLLRYLGVGLAYANMLSLGFIFLPMLAAILYRIDVEEQTLQRRFGSEYAEYARNTKRLIPHVY